MAMLPGYRPNQKNLALPPGLDRNINSMGSVSGGTLAPGQDPANFNRSYVPPPPRQDGRPKPLPQVTPPGELMYDTGNGYVPLYKDIGLGGGALGTFRNMSTSGIPIYAPAGAIPDFSKVVTQTGVDQYTPYYGLSDTGVPQTVSGSLDGVPQYRGTLEHQLPNQVSGTGQNLQDFFFDMLLNRVNPSLTAPGTSGNLNWEELANALGVTGLTPDGLDAIRRLFGFA